MQLTKTLVNCVVLLNTKLGKRSNIAKMEREFKEAKLVILGHISYIGVSKAN